MKLADPIAGIGDQTEADRPAFVPEDRFQDTVVTCRVGTWIR